MLRQDSKILRRCAGVAVPVAGTLLTAWPALAAEEGGLPQLRQVDTFASQIFWLLVTFGFLYWVMTRVALPRITSVMEERQDKIDDDLARAERLRAEADEVLGEYEAALSKAREEAAGLLKQTGDEIKKERSERLGGFGRELAERTRKAEAEIDEAKREAIKNLAAAAAESAMAATQKLIGVKPTKAAVDSALEDAQRGRI